MPNTSSKILCGLNILPGLFHLPGIDCVVPQMLSEALSLLFQQHQIFSLTWFLQLVARWQCLRSCIVDGEEDIQQITLCIYSREKMLFHSSSPLHKLLPAKIVLWIV